MEMVDEIAWPKKAKPEMAQGVAFFNLMRDFTASGFFTSQMGVKDLGYAGNTPNKWNGVPDDVLKLVKKNNGVVMVNFYSGFVVPEGARASREMNGVPKGDAGLSIAGTIHLRASILAARGAMPGAAWENMALRRR